MSLGKYVLENNIYIFPVLGDNFIIKYCNEKYFVFRKGNSCLIRVSINTSLQLAKESLVNWINENMKVTYPNLTL